ncbi:tryptophan--tRNA ligase [soil metagenome]
MNERAAAKRKRVFSGIQPSGVSHIGNLLGATRNWVLQQEHFDNIFCIVNLHALTLPTTPETLHANTITMANMLLASGIDPEQSILFVQGDVPQHAALSWLLNSVTMNGELRRMTQFKDKSGSEEESVSAALFVYPVLQTADILLYDTDLVPVGEDQKQHIELARDIAQRFNARYGETFVVPAPDIKMDGARIMALDDPTKKMSKSDRSAASYIALTDSPDEITRKIKRAVTDSGSEVRAGRDKPALTNLLSIYSLFSGVSVAELEDRYDGKGYGAFKSDLAEVVVEALRPIQFRLGRLESDSANAIDVLRDGAERAGAFARQKMVLVDERMGLSQHRA